MKISSAIVRRSRLERGWSQEQLAIASGVSLRTVQRVEADGVAALGTAASLAATFGVPIALLQDDPAERPQPLRCGIDGTLFIGLAVLTLAALGASGRLPGPATAGFAALDLLAAIAALALLIPAGIRVVRTRRYAAALLAVAGTPLVTLLAGGLVVAATEGRAPLAPLVGIGTGGLALVVLAMREFRSPGRRAMA